MDELTKKEEMEDKKSPSVREASFSHYRRCRCNSGNFPKGKIPGLVATSTGLQRWEGRMGIKQ